MHSDNYFPFYVAAFVLGFGALLLRYIRVVPRSPQRTVALSGIAAIVGLVSISGLFCSADIVKILLEFAAFPLVVLVCDDGGDEKKPEDA